MAQNLYKTSDSIYILSDTIENAAEKYKTSKGQDAPSIDLFKSSASVIAVADTANVTIQTETGGVTYPNTITAQAYAVGTIIQLNAVPASGYSFTNWKDGEGNILSASAKYNHTVTEEDIIIIPVFTEVPRVLTTVAPTNGTSYPDYAAGQNFSKGDNIQFNAVPDSGYNFTNWVDGDGVELSTSAQYTHVMDEDITIEAIFTVI